MSIILLVKVEFVKVVFEELVHFLRGHHSFVSEHVYESLDLETALVADSSRGRDLGVPLGGQQSD